MHRFFVILCGALAPVSVPASAKGPLCPQGRRELERPEWRRVARELEDRQHPLDWPEQCELENEESQEREVVLGFHEACDSYHNSGFMEGLVSDWIPQSKQLALARALLHRWILGGQSPRASLSPRSAGGPPWPFEADDVLQWTPAAFQLRTHPIFRADRHRCSGSYSKNKPGLHSGDADALARVSPLLGPRCNGLTDPCSCSQVRCAQMPPDAPCAERTQRVVALRLVNAMADDLSHAVDALADLTELRALIDLAGALSRLPSGLHHLEVLELTHATALPVVADLRWLSLRAAEEEAVVAPGSKSMLRKESPDADLRFNSASLLEPVCAYEGLKVLRVKARLNALPACLGNLSELRGLEVSGNHFGQGLERPEAALPLELGRLTKLVEFAAYGMGLISVKDERLCPEDVACELDYESAIEFARKQEGLAEDDNPETAAHLPPATGERYKCPRRAWDAKLDDLQAIFSWSSIQKFWLDGSHVSASSDFFPKAAAAWPHLRTLDLYDNRLEVDVSGLTAFGQHRDLHQLMLGRNNLQGELPVALFGANFPWRSVQLSMNSHLRGCAPEELKHVVRLAGTNVGFKAGCRPPNYSEESDGSVGEL